MKHQMYTCKNMVFSNKTSNTYDVLDGFKTTINNWGDVFLKKKVFLIGAGGKMGLVISQRLKSTDEYDSFFCEVSEEGINKLRSIGISQIADIDTSVPEADIVILGIPDKLIGKLSGVIIPKMKTGAMIIGLDPGAAYAGVMPIREDIAYFVVHPHHPYLFNTETDENGNLDLFMGTAHQDCSCAVYKAPEGTEDIYYEEGEKISRIIWAPVGKTFRITVEQMGMCEPGLVESIGAPMIYALKQAYDRFVEMGVPEDALFSFLMGHLRVQIAIYFKMIPQTVSDGANLALEMAMKDLFKDDWLNKMTSKKYIYKNVCDITDATNK